MLIKEVLAASFGPAIEESFYNKRKEDCYHQTDFTNQAGFRN